MISVPVNDSPGAGHSTVLELPGLYGPFTFPEKLLQKIWMRRAFQEVRAATTAGQAVTILDQGKWNLLGGPDFKNARVKFGDGPERIGDIELHLKAEDWSAHGHARDPAYDRVILHVVLFPPSVDHVTVGAGQAPIPVLALLPLLPYDLEEYAAEDAVESLANRPASQIVELLGVLSGSELESLLLKYAAERWRQKVRYAGLRIQRLGWDEACHQTALDILGYRFNRTPMLRIAGRVPLTDWHKDVQADAIYAQENGWSLQGLRPANHPRLRLHQYREWTARIRGWPEVLKNEAAQLPNISERVGTGDVRRKFCFSKLRSDWTDAITGGTVTGTRFDNLVCDGFFPLLAAAGVCDPAGLWFHWFTGDVPPLWRQALRQLEVFAGRTRPACHGSAQGLLGWLIERERLPGVPAGRRA